MYKYLEALAWEIGRTRPRCRRGALPRRSSRGSPPRRSRTATSTRVSGAPGRQPRWSALEWGHELYCLGHLFQAAVARARTRPGADDGLLQIATRAADLVCDVFGPDGRNAVCGHPEIETGLAELGRATGSARYVAQASLFIDRRGHGTLADIEFGRKYYQDDIPVREADVLRGHAVRANYLAAGAVDVAVENDDGELLAALSTQWAEHGRAPHLPDRRPGLPSPGRGLRRRLGAAPGSGVLGDVRGRGVDPVQLADAARRGRRQVRRPHRAHAVQRRRDIAGRRRPFVLLREHAAPAPPRGAGRPRRGLAARRVLACARPGSRSRAARPTSRVRWRASPRTSRRRMPAASSSISTSPRRSTRPSRRAPDRAGRRNRVPPRRTRADRLALRLRRTVDTAAAGAGVGGRGDARRRPPSRRDGSR